MIKTRQTPASKPEVAAVILAAGQSRRMGEANKLLTRLNGKSFIRHVATSAIAAGLDEVVVVTGHEAERIKAELSGLTLSFAHNRNFAGGISSSLRTGIKALGPRIDAALILLADMPFITEDIIRKIIASRGFDHDQRIVIPCCKGRRGNPVLWPRHYFRELASLNGDRGARQLFDAHAQDICEIDMAEEVLIDIDTPARTADIGAKQEKVRNDPR